MIPTLACSSTSGRELQDCRERERSSVQHHQSSTRSHSRCTETTKGVAQASAFSAPLLMTFSLSNVIEQQLLNRPTQSTTAVCLRNVGGPDLNRTNNQIKYHLTWYEIERRPNRNIYLHRQKIVGQKKKRHRCHRKMHEYSSSIKVPQQLKTHAVCIPSHPWRLWNEQMSQRERSELTENVVWLEKPKLHSSLHASSHELCRGLICIHNVNYTYPEHLHSMHAALLAH